MLIFALFIVLDCLRELEIHDLIIFFKSIYILVCFLKKIKPLNVKFCL